jgi:hypothetical protein
VESVCEEKKLFLTAEEGDEFEDIGLHPDLSCGVGGSPCCSNEVNQGNHQKDNKPWYRS